MPHCHPLMALWWFRHQFNGESNGHFHLHRWQWMLHHQMASEDQSCHVWQICTIHASRGQGHFTTVHALLETRSHCQILYECHQTMLHLQGCTRQDASQSSLSKQISQGLRYLWLQANLLGLQGRQSHGTFCQMPTETQCPYPKGVWEQSQERYYQSKNGPQHPTSKGGHSKQQETELHQPQEQGRSSRTVTCH